MEKMKIKTSILLFLLIALGLIQACNEKHGDEDLDFIFPKGAQGSAETFTGQVWNYGLVPSDRALSTLVGNVYFEPGARSHWHSHPAGQILLITDGAGFHQIEGQPKQTLKKGDVVTVHQMSFTGTVPALKWGCSNSTSFPIQKKVL